MHELQITESILNIAMDYATKEGATEITDLYLTIGDLATVVDDSVQFYWNIIAKETIAENAQLHFERIKTELLCMDCNARFHPNPEDFTCPNCGSVQVKVIRGDEFSLDAIDIETEKRK